MGGSQGEIVYHERNISGTDIVDLLQYCYCYFRAIGFCLAYPYGVSISNGEVRETEDQQ